MPIDWFPLWLSLRVAAIATLAALVLGVCLAHLLAYRKFRGKALLDAALTLPLVLPPAVLVYFVLVWLGWETALGRLYESLFGAPLVFTWQAAAIAATIHATPLLLKWSLAAMESVDPGYARAARGLGASEWRVFWRVTLPLARRSILAAAVLAFAKSLGDFSITILLAGFLSARAQILSGAVYDAVQAGNGALARALALIISVVVLGVLLAANRLGLKQATG